MRHLALLMIALAAAGCSARNGGPDFRHGPPMGGPGMPPEGPGPGMRPDGGSLLFVSPMGEPFRAQPGDTAPQERWFVGADGDGDGAITLTEFVADAQRFFKLLDRKGDGEIDPQDIEAYETVLLPEIRVAGGGMGAGRPRGPEGPGGGPDGGGPGGGGEGRGGNRMTSRGPTMGGGKQGAGRFGYLDYPQPVIAADRNFNRGIDPDEFTFAARQRFAMLDLNRDGKLTRDELPRLRPARTGPLRRPPE
jgi:hypothetical protein